MIRKSNARLQPIMAGIRVTRALYDTCIPVIQGRFRMPYLMTWTGNFQVHTKGSSKKTKSLKKGAQVTSYTANFDFLIGFGPVISFGTMWRNHDQFWNSFVGSQQFNLIGTGTDFSGQVSNSPGPLVNILAVTVQLPYSYSFNDYGGTGPVSQSGTVTVPLYNANYTPLFVLQPGQGQNYCTYGGVDTWVGSNLNLGRIVQSSGPGNPNWSVHVDSGITNPTITVYYLYWPPSYPNWILSNNYYPEAILGSGAEYNYPGGSAFQIQYPEFFGLGTFNFDMGMSNTPPNDNIEVVCMNNFSTNGDVNPADFILDIITSGNYWPYNPTSSSWAHGLSLLPANNKATYLYAPNILSDPPVPAPGNTKGSPPYSLGLSAVRDYCNAYSIWISGALDSQRTAADWVDEFCEIANCAAVWNGSKLSFVPRCEVSAFGWGSTFTAPTASGPLYTIDDSVYIAGKGEDPVTVLRNENQDPRSIPNLIRIQHKYRGDGYYSDWTTTYRDDASITRYGIVSTSPKNWPFIQDPATALKCAAPVLRRMQMIDPIKIKFKLPVSHCLLDCYDMIALNDSYLGWTGYPVRLTSMEEDADRVITCEAEPFIYGAHCPTNQTPASTTGSGFSGNTNVPVTTLVNAPIIFEPVTQLSEGTEQIWIAVSDTDTNYGGCDIYMSSDGGNDYSYLGALVGQSTMGVVYNSTYPSSPDPDATDTLYVDLTESSGVLGTYPNSSRDAFVPVCYLAPGGTSTINGSSVTIPYELIAYATATLQTGNKYALTPTIRRGVYSTPDVAHAIGQLFAYLGPGANIFKYNLSPSLIGTTLYFKFCAFNKYATNPQDISTVTAYSFAPTGLGQTSSQPTSTQTYSISPSVVMYQGKSGGWPGVATGSSSWTDPTKVYFAPFTVTWTDGVTVGYNISPMAITGSTPETLYGAVYDPGRTGNGTSYLSTTNYSGQSGYIALGSIFIANTSSGGGSQTPPSGTTPYDIMCYFNGTPTASYAMLRYIPDRSIYLPANLTGSKAKCLTAPTGSVTLTLLQNGSSIGTVNFAAGATTATFTFTNSVTLAAGDILEIDAPATPDSTFATISITLMATR